VSDNNPKNQKILPFKNTISILLAEDNMINQFAAKHIMKDWNVNLDIAETGNEAIKMYQEGNYDLILMDMYMPEINGFEATKFIKADMKKRNISIPIIGLSAVVLEDDINKAKEAGVLDIISKPFEPEKLNTMMHKYLALKHS